MISRPAHPATASGAAKAPAWRRLGRRALSLGYKAAIVALALTAARSTLADQYLVPTPSMAPTIEPGDTIFVDKAAYGLRIPFTSTYLIEREGPRAGDVVVLADPRGGEISLVKRVVAREGQSVELRHGILWVDGELQALESLPNGRLVQHIGGLTHEAGSLDLGEFGPITVPAGHVFLLGDNRAASLDSRELGTVPRSLMRGRVLGVLHGRSSNRALLAVNSQ